MIVMGAGANDKCLIDADEMKDDHPLERAAFEFLFLDELLLMQTVEEWQEDSAVLRMLYVGLISARYSCQMLQSLLCIY